MSKRSIRSMALPALALGIVLFSFGCAKTPSTEESVTPMATGQNNATPSIENAREAAQMAVAIENEPARLTEILESHGMTREAYEELLYTIAQDADLTEAYEAARTDSSS